MNDYALLINGVLQRISRYETRPENIPHKGAMWYPVVRETGASFQGLIGDNYVIRTPDPAKTPPTADQMISGAQYHIDQTAMSRDYESALALVSYVTSTVQQWRNEANTFVPWRDSVWAYTYETIAKIASGEIPPPANLDEFISSIPKIKWPNG